jgi:hypothetical protein
MSAKQVRSPKLVELVRIKSNHRALWFILVVAGY